MGFLLRSGERQIAKHSHPQSARMRGWSTTSRQVRKQSAREQALTTVDSHAMVKQQSVVAPLSTALRGQGVLTVP